MWVNGVDLIDKDDMVVRAAHRQGGCFEPETFLYLLNIPVNGTFVDAGAYTGVYGIWAAKCGFNVKMFEPHPVTYKRMLHNMFNNEVVCDCHNVALSDVNGRSPFYTNIKMEMSSASSLEKGKYQSLHDEVSVCAYDQFSTCDETVIKIDVEGAEMKVLEGMYRTLDTQKPVVIVEVLGEQQEKDVVAFLKPYGYNSVGMFDGRNLILRV